MQARINSKFLRKIVNICKTTKTTILATNQYRMKIGQLFGDPRTGSGGKSYKYYSSIRIETKRNDTIMEKGEAIGLKTRIKILKNKVGIPYKETEVTLLFGKGYDVEGEWVEHAIKHQVIGKRGGWYDLPNIEKPIQGLESVKIYLKENPEYYEKEIKSKVKALVKPPVKTRQTKEVIKVEEK